MSEKYCPIGKIECERLEFGAPPNKYWCKDDNALSIANCLVEQRRIINGYELCPWPSKQKPPKKPKRLSEAIAEMAVNDNAWPSKPTAKCIIDAVEKCIPDVVLYDSINGTILRDLKKGIFL